MDSYWKIAAKMFGGVAVVAVLVLVGLANAGLL
jgi:hypothetical protein